MEKVYLKNEIAKAQAKVLNEFKLEKINELLKSWENDKEVFDKLKEIKVILESRV